MGLRYRAMFTGEPLPGQKVGIRILEYDSESDESAAAYAKKKHPGKGWHIVMVQRLEWTTIPMGLYLNDTFNQEEASG